MPEGNPLGYLSPEAQMQLLGSVPSPIGGTDAGLGQMLMSALNGTAAQPRDFSPDTMDLLDVRQGVKTPAWLAEKNGVPIEQVLQKFPEFKQQYASPAPSQSGQPNPTQPRPTATSAGQNLLDILAGDSPLSQQGMGQTPIRPTSAR